MLAVRKPIELSHSDKLEKQKQIQKTSKEMGLEDAKKELHGKIAMPMSSAFPMSMFTAGAAGRSSSSRGTAASNIKIHTGKI